MNIKNILKAGLVAIFATVMLAAPTFAACSGINSGKVDSYPDLYFETGKKPSKAPGGYPTYCQRARITDESGESLTVYIYATNQSACAQAGIATADGNLCSEDSGFTLNEIVSTVISTIIYIIGIVAVIMIIIGGIHYATSQGDAAKVKKGKDTILYGIIGLVIAILAYAIVNFVLEALNK